MEHAFKRIWSDLYDEDTHYAECSCKFWVECRSKDERSFICTSHLMYHNFDYKKDEEGRLIPSNLRTGILIGKKPPPWTNLTPGFCKECDDEDRSGPCHIGSPFCKSGGIGNLGTRTHCSCDLCF